jgi:hypothetical protein
MARFIGPPPCVLNKPIIADSEALPGQPGARPGILRVKRTPDLDLKYYSLEAKAAAVGILQVHQAVAFHALEICKNEKITSDSCNLAYVRHV